MKTHTFVLGPTDTDSISFCKQDGSPFTEEEQYALLDEINSMMPEKIKFAHDGYFEKIIAFRAKNYVLYDGKKIKYKGSAIKASTKEPALKQFIKDIIAEILNDTNEFEKVYNRYILEILNVKDINRWATRKTITSKVLDAKRANEQKVLDAIQGTEFSEGDRVYLYFREDSSLQLAEKFANDHDKTRLLEKLFKTTKIFDAVIPVGTFINYKLKKNQKLLTILFDNSL